MIARCRYALCAFLDCGSDSSDIRARRPEHGLSSRVTGNVFLDSVGE